MCPRMYYSGLKSEVNIVNILLLLLILRKTRMGVFIIS